VSVLFVPTSTSDCHQNDILNHNIHICYYNFLACLLDLCGAILDDLSAMSICNSPDYLSYGSGDSGTIVSDIDPRSMNTSCTLTITTCSRCRIKLNFTNLFGDSAAINHDSHQQSFVLSSVVIC
jgi:hypothetical protein